MTTASNALSIIPVLSTDNIERDLKWYEKYVGFKYCFGDDGYAGLQRENLEFHLQWHHGTDEDPVYGSVMKFFVSDLKPYYEEFLKRGTITEEKLHMNTPWGTHEFSFYDLNRNGIFVVQDA